MTNLIYRSNCIFPWTYKSTFKPDSVKICNAQLHVQINSHGFSRMWWVCDIFGLKEDKLMSPRNDDLRETIYLSNQQSSALLMCLKLW